MAKVTIQTQRVNGSWQTVQVVSTEPSKLAVYLKSALRLSQARPKKARAIDDKGNLLDLVTE